MRIVNSLLLGSAATLIAVAGAQAADLPVKAKAVEYVKVCSLYGAGFYYIPGTDTCIKIGGFVRAEWDINAAGSHSPYLTGSNAKYTLRDTNDVTSRSRALISFDVRSQTEYGTLRAYARVGAQSTTAAAPADPGGIGGDKAVFHDRAFIQFAGFTFGLTQSFYDPSGPALNGTLGFWSDTGGAGTNVIAYTAQLGNGVSATLAIEDGSYRRTALINTNLETFPVGATAASDYAGNQLPDLVANLRVDQAWGSAQIMGALHQVNGAYYTANTMTTVPFGTTPGDEVGWAIGAFINLLVPTGPGDRFILTGTYSEGAVSYAGNNIRSVGMYGTGGALPGQIGSIALGWAADGVYGIDASGAGTSIELTTAWSAFASFEHYWTPALRSSIVGGVFGVEYDSAAATLICANIAFTGSCDPDFSVFQIGSRTVWTPVRNLDLSVEAIYSKVNQNMVGTWALPASGSRPAGNYAADDQDTWSFIFRAQRNFWL